MTAGAPDPPDPGPTPAGRPRRADGWINLWLTSRREIVTRGRSKSYLIGLIASVLLVGGVAGLPTLFGDAAYEVGVTGPAAEATAPVLEQRAEAVETDLSVTVVPDEPTARQAVADGDLDAVLTDDARVFTDGPLAPQLEQLLDTAHQLAASQRQLAEAGLDPEQVAELMEVAPLEYVSVVPEAPESPVANVVAMAVVLLMMLGIYLPAVYVATGVVEEKSSRVVELLLAAIRPWQLLGGKVLGIGLLSFVQLGVVAVTGTTVAAVTGLADDIPSELPGLVASVLIWFLLGYAFFGTVSAASGALVSRQEDVSGVLTPVSMLMAASYVVGFYASFNPGTTLVQVLSVVPPASAVVMPVRTVTEPVPWWEVAAAIVLMVAATCAVLALGAKVYRRAVLRTGGRLRLSEVLGGRSSGSSPDGAGQETS